MQMGSLIRLKFSKDLYPTPVFIWQIVDQGGKRLFIVNAPDGKANADLEIELSNGELLLPNHAKFICLEFKQIMELYEIDSCQDYQMVSDMIKSSYGNVIAINLSYVIMHLVHIVKFDRSVYCEEIIDKIESDPYTTIKKISSITEQFEYQKQVSFNLKALLDLAFIPKKFALLKFITIMKEITSSNFPAKNNIYDNYIFEELCLGMFLSYYSANREKIASVTINYSQKFPGDYRVFQQFINLIERFQPEMDSYNTVKAEEDKIRLTAAASGFKLPEDENGKGLIMKLLEFDLGFWQRFILLDIVKDIPVKKPYKDSYSISHNYMLLLPFFQWLSPHNFPDYNDKNVKAENYQKIMVERMKSFEEGKI